MQGIDQLQLEAYPRMKGEERLRIGLGLYEASRAVAREAIRARFPDASDAIIAEKLRQGSELAIKSNRGRTPCPAQRRRNPCDRSMQFEFAMTEEELLVDCFHRLKRSGVAYMLVGSMAGNYWELPRSTRQSIGDESRLLSCCR